MRKTFDNDVTAFLSFQQGEQDAFMYFFNSHYPPLVFFANSLIKDQPEAEDIADEAFLKAWDQHDQFVSQDNLKAFLYRVTKNACIDHLRKRKTLKLYAELNRQESFEDAGIEQKIIQAEMIAGIYQWLQLLPPKCRQVFSLLYIDGKAPAEVADELSLSVNTVRVQKARAIQILKKQLGAFVLVLFINSL